MLTRLLPFFALLIICTTVIVFVMLKIYQRLRAQLESHQSSFSEHQFQFEAIKQRMQHQEIDYGKQQVTQQFTTEKLFHDFKAMIVHENRESRESFQQQQLTHLSLIQQGLQQTSTSLQQQLLEQLGFHGNAQHNQLNQIMQHIQERLQTISQQVDRRLNEGFEKTTDTFTRIVERLAMIDAAQKKITELSTNVVNLQELLSDKRARGAFGEVQLSGLLHNMLPESAFSLQYTLSNGKRADCILFLPAPTGNIAIDAKFPLENYRIMTNPHQSETERKQAEQRFRIDIKKHIQDIASKYIIEGETADGAMMFIPAEAIFCEIHGHYPELIEFAQKMRVWLASPTTLMAILTTARAVLKDAATRQQIHIIQEHLRVLASDFGRFEKRMDALSRHIDLAHSDVNEIKTSAQKITQRFHKIDQVDLIEEDSK